MVRVDSPHLQKSQAYPSLAPTKFILIVKHYTEYFRVKYKKKKLKGLPGQLILQNNNQLFI